MNAKAEEKIIGSRSDCECNYSNNYYGDQLCLERKRGFKRK